MPHFELFVFVFKKAKEKLLQSEWGGGPGQRRTWELSCYLVMKSQREVIHLKES
jgi:hypothetical protein